MMRIGCSCIQRCLADGLPAEQLLDSPNTHPASSFVAGHKQLYASGYRDRKLDVSGTQRFACN